MKVIKPLKLSLLYKVYENNKKQVFVSTVISLFSFYPSGKIENEIDLWKMLQEEIGPETLFDLGMPKKRAEVLIHGGFYSPTGKSVQAGTVRVKLGNLDKELNIFGDREWRKRNTRWEISDPQEILSLPINYQNSFGGPEYAKNPLGKGYIPSMDQLDKTSYPLPNIIDPRQPLLLPTDQIEPAGFQGYELTWPQRYAKTGTYDQKWLKELFPGFAKDFDPTFFNAAPLDQQFEGFLIGNEEFSCENMHPERSSLQSRLPGIHPRCFVNQSVEDSLRFSEIPLVLDTVLLFPHLEKGILIHRGSHDVSDNQARDISEILVAYERETDTPRSKNHYLAALERRLDPEKGHLYALKENDLIPDDDVSGLQELVNETIKDKKQGLFEKHLQEKIKLEAERSKKEFNDLGFTTGNTFDHKTTLTAQNSGLDDLDNLDLLVEKSLKDMQDKQEAMKKECREMSESMGLDHEKLAQDDQKKNGGRIQFSSDEISADLRKFGRLTKEKENQLKQTEQQFNDLYRQYGHHNPATVYSNRKNEENRATLLKYFSKNEPMNGMDFTGVNLSGMNLDGIDLENCFLEGADLSNTQLKGANLKNCMLARANMAHAVCDMSKMDAVNLGDANLTGTSFSNCSMDNAVLFKANMEGAQFHGASLKEADFMQCEGLNANLNRADISKGQFIESKLEGADFSESNISEALFIQTKLHRVNFSKASLCNTTIVQCQGDGAIFHQADLTGVSASVEISFRDADFSFCKLINANLRGGDFTGAMFTEADLSNADLSETKLENSRFYRAIAKQTQFMNADLSRAYMVSINLFEGSLQMANLTGTDLRGSNLFAADLLHTDFSNARIEQANIGQTIL